VTEIRKHEGCGRQAERTIKDIRPQTPRCFQRLANGVHFAIPPQPWVIGRQPNVSNIVQSELQHPLI